MSILRCAFAFAGCVMLAGCAITPPEADPVVQKLTELDTRLLRIERVLSNQSLLDLSQRIEATQAELRELRGRLDEMQFNLTRTQDQQRELYADIDRRLSSLGTGLQVDAPPVQSNAPTLAQGDERAIYQVSFDMLRDGKYAEAIRGFQQYLTSFPDGTLVDNAQYWLGEARYVTREYVQALQDFRAVLDKYPDSRKVPDALLKIGYCNYELKNWGAARNALNEVVQKFPDATAAKLASQRLAKMEAEGR